MNEEPLNPENLLQDDSFIRWVLHKQDAAVWEKYMLDHPDYSGMILRTTELVRELHAAEGMTASLADEHVVWSRITHSLEQEREKVVEHPALLGWRKWLVAAVVLIFCGLAAWQYFPKKKTITYKELIRNAEEVNLLSERVNDGTSPLHITLGDGSKVTLEPGSKLSYPETFNAARREVYLSGEGFFEVKKNPDVPFYVYANETVTRVLGTSFSIRAFDADKQVTVNVRTGRVSVYKQARTPVADPEKMAIVLLPNQQVTFDRENQSLIKNLVEIPVPILDIPAQKSRKFEEVPVSEIFRELEKIYGVKILFDSDQLAGCIVSTSVRNEPLFDNLEVICRTIGATYKEIDAQIVVESRGCL